MTTPEPLDEKLPVPVEVRGGDRAENFIHEDLPYGYVPGDCGPGCGCGDQDCEEKK